MSHVRSPAQDHAIPFRDPVINRYMNVGKGASQRVREFSEFFQIDRGIVQHLALP